MKHCVMSVVLLLASASAFAASKNSTFTVSANVVANCTIAASDLAFGNYDPVVTNNTGGADLYANSTVTVACTKGAPNVWIGLDAGANGASATGTTRAMAGGGSNFLSYDLYTANPNPAAGTVWGNTQATGKSYVSTSKVAMAITVFGRVPKGQDAAVGGYSDTVTATINY